MWTRRDISLWSRSALVLVCIFVCNACYQEEAKTTPVNTPPKKSGEQKLTKTKSLEECGFIDESLSFYEQLCNSKYNQKIRNDAYWQRLAILEKQQNYSKFVEVAEDFRRDFPEESDNIWCRLLKVYLDTWDWENAYEVFIKIKGKKLDPVVANKVSWLNDLRKRTKVWQENFDHLRDDWCLTNPYATSSFFQINSGKLEAQLTTPSWYHAGYRFYWSGENTMFSFDITIQRLDIGGNVNIGFFRNTTTHEGDYIKARFSCYEKSEDTEYQISLSTQNGEERGKTIQKRGGHFRLGVEYHVVIDYLKVANQVKMLVYEKSTQIPVVEEIVEFHHPLEYGDGFFGFANDLEINFGVRFQGRAAIDNMAIYTKPEAFSLAQNPSRLGNFYEANLSAMRGKTTREKEIYQKEMSKEQCPWPFWEMRALGYLHSKEENKETKYLSDLKELIKRCPTHPNKKYFDQQIDIWQRKLDQ